MYHTWSAVHRTDCGSAPVQPEVPSHGHKAANQTASHYSHPNSDSDTLPAQKRLMRIKGFDMQQPVIRITVFIQEFMRQTEHLLQRLLSQSADIGTVDFILLICLPLNAAAVPLHRHAPSTDHLPVLARTPMSCSACDRLRHHPPSSVDDPRSNACIRRFS